jgi:hypothetical protein
MGRSAAAGLISSKFEPDVVSQTDCASILLGGLLVAGNGSYLLSFITTWDGGKGGGGCQAPWLCLMHATRLCLMSHATSASLIL